MIFSKHMLNLEDLFNGKHPYAAKLTVEGKDSYFSYIRKPKGAKPTIMDKMNDEAQRKRADFVRDNGYDVIAIGVVSDRDGLIKMKLICNHG